MYDKVNKKHFVKVASIFDHSLLCLSAHRMLFVRFLLAQAIVFAAFTSHSQSINEIITDYQGYWKSGVGAINPIKPNNDHNLLSFSFNGLRYSTGVNDALLASHGNSFVSGDYRSLPVQSINGVVNSNTKVGVGAMYDGVPVGPSNPAPANNLPYYLTDGQKGLNIGTCIANLPAGTLFFSVGSINPAYIGDGIPDVVITQTADPSTTFDRYEFTDINGTKIGNHKDIVLNSITPVGNWMADFYEASTNPMHLASGYTNTERPLRLWAADFSEFGITSTNIAGIAYFKITLNGTSDVAFVAYNNSAINFSIVLPVEFSFFTASHNHEGIQLAWQTLAETNTDHFSVETSSDGINFYSLGNKKAAGYSSTRVNYTFLHSNPTEGKNFYRLKQVDQDGKFKYSKIVQVDVTEKNSLQVFPNPASTKLLIHHEKASGNEQLQIVTARGNVALQSILKPGTTQTSLNDLRLSRGLYFVVIINEKQRSAQALMIR